MRTEDSDPSRLMDLLPTSGFLPEYEQWARPTTMAPAHFHVFAGLFTVASVVGRRVCIEYGPQALYPNLFLAFLAPSSRFHKTSAQTPAKRLLSAFETTRQTKDGPQPASLLLEREFSAESLYDILSEQPCGVLLWGEMGHALKRLAKDYNSGVVEFLTECYDCPSEPIRKRLRSGSWTIKDPCISIFATTTLPWLEGNLTEELALGGFLPRWLIVPATKTEAFIALPPPLDAAKEAALKSKLAELCGMYPQGESQIAEVHRIAGQYKTWARDLDAEMSGCEHEDLLAAWYTRLMPLALKLSLLFELGTTGEPTISSDSWERGRTAADFLKTYLRQLVTGDEGLAFSEYQRNRRKVLSLIRTANTEGIARSDLFRRMKLPSRDLDGVLDSLMNNEGIVRPGPERQSKRGPKATTYVLAENCTPTD